MYVVEVCSDLSNHVCELPEGKIDALEDGGCARIVGHHNASEFDHTFIWPHWGSLSLRIFLGNITFWLKLRQGFCVGHRTDLSLSF